ncbi:AAA family ATPase [Actinoplanes couchii]|uniref:AAA family ATPase n=1 Tax=Actinoplanes couchii TaxID=403638 RepID=A0ABQ3WZU4_9ACTN|nr:AAA family ATPase [Actinoplanes couchii]MDR6316201.1 hypothetical protein [Actinoplanes couchii]GID51816.1 hypothetical protein Aco03nite_002200 [Actinoplanes couchii]
MATDLNCPECDERLLWDPFWVVRHSSTGVKPPQHRSDSACWLNTKVHTNDIEWTQRSEILAIPEMEEEEALAAAHALTGMDLWRLCQVLGSAAGYRDPRWFEFDIWREKATESLRHRADSRRQQEQWERDRPRIEAERLAREQEQECKAATAWRSFVDTHDRALELAPQTGGGVRFMCPECGSPAAAGPYVHGVWATHTLKSGHHFESGTYSGSCPLATRWDRDDRSPEIQIDLLPANPPVSVRTEPEEIEGTLTLDDDDAGDDREWLLPGLIGQGDYLSLFGPSGLGKSLLMLDWSLRMAQRGIRVLYLNKENPRAAIKARLKAMKAPRDLANLTILPFVQIPDLATPEGAAALAGMAERNMADLIVLDTISKFSSVGQATQSDRWTTRYNRSFVPLLDRGVAIMQIDHTGKGGQPVERDSGVKRDNVSIAYALMPGSAEGALVLTRAKNRVHYPGDDAITLNRVTSPTLTHTTGAPVDPEILGALRDLDTAQVPIDASRDKARDALKAAGISMANDLLGRVLRLRRASDEE